MPLGDGLPRASTRTRARKEIGEVRKRWATKQKGVGAILTEIVTKNPFAGRVDPEAERAVAQLDAMQGELAERPFALAHMNVHVWGGTREVADQRAAQVAAYLNGQGLRARQATLNSTYAPLGDMPGNVSEEVMNVRRLRVEMAAVTRLSPVTGRQPGHARGLALRRPGAADGDDPARRAAVLRAQRARGPTARTCASSARRGPARARSCP